MKQVVLFQLKITAITQQWLLSRVTDWSVNSLQAASETSEMSSLLSEMFIGILLCVLILATKADGPESTLSAGHEKILLSSPVQFSGKDIATSAHGFQCSNFIFGCYLTTLNDCISIE